MANENSLLAQTLGCASLLMGPIHLILPSRIGRRRQHHRFCSSLQILIIVGLQIHFWSESMHQSIV